MLERLVARQLTHAKALFVILLIIVAAGVYVGSQLKLDPSFSALVSDTSEYNTNQRILEGAFATNDAVILMATIDRNTPLKEHPSSIAAASDYFDDAREVLSQSQYVTGIGEMEIAEDGETAQMVVRLATPDRVGGFRETLDELNLLLDEAGVPPGINAQLTGLPILLNRVSLLLIQDNLGTILITLGLIFIVMFFYFQDLRMTLLTIAAPILSIVLLAAAMAALDIAVTITLAAVGVLTLGLGADYSIHIATHYKYYRMDGKAPKEAVLLTVEELWIPITASFLTTAAGFAALILGVSPSSQAQGTVLALAIAIIYTITLFAYPVLLYLFTKKSKFSHNKVFAKIRGFFAKLAIVQAHHPYTVLGVLTFITIIMFFGAAQVEFSTSNSNWIPDDDPISISFRELNYAFGNVDTMDIVLIANQGDLRDVQTARDVGRLVAQLETIPFIDVIDSPYSGIPYDRSELHDMITHTDVRNRFNNDYTLTTIGLVSENFGQDDSGDNVVLEEVRDILDRTTIHHADVSLYGDSVRFDELGDSLQQDAGVTTMIGLLLVFVVASLIYFSVSVGFIALIPIVVGVIWAVGMMGYFNVPFTSLSTGIISLVLGVGVDFSIHLVDSIRKNLCNGSIDEAIAKALDTSGNAILLSSITTFFGFIALTFAVLLGTQRLGWSLAFSIVSVFIVAITMVPAIMSLVQKFAKKSKRKSRVAA